MPGWIPVFCAARSRVYATREGVGGVGGAGGEGEGVDCAEFTRQQRIMMSHLLRALFFLPNLAFSSSFFLFHMESRKRREEAAALVVRHCVGVPEMERSSTGQSGRDA